MDNSLGQYHNNMQITTEKSQQIYDWLLNRGISAKVIEDSKIYWTGHEIAIPIFDKHGVFLFNKYRKDPFVENDMPKYRYEVGSQASLYNAHTVFGLINNCIFIVEGELDALRLNSLGLLAVSSTGGSGTFKKEWLDDFDNNYLYIVYDRDDAGIKGALKVNEMHPTAKIVFLPWMEDGKDVTDYFKENVIKDFESLVADSFSWVLNSEPKEIPNMKIETHKVIKAYQEEDEILQDKQRLFNQEGKQTRHIELLREKVVERLDYWKKHYANLSKKFPSTYLKNDNQVARAKAVPISNYIQFNRQGFALCLWHNEKTPSMKYHPERNKVFCHGCNAHKDTIDVVMATRNVEFAQALKMILGTSTLP